MNDITFSELISMRLDRFLKIHYPKLTQGVLERFLRKNMILVNQFSAKSNLKLQMNDKITFKVNLQYYAKQNYYDPNDDDIKPNNITLETILIAKKILDKILYEDENYLVINKWSNISTQLGTNLTISINCGLNALNAVIDYIENYHITQDVLHIISNISKNNVNIKFSEIDNLIYKQFTNEISEKIAEEFGFSNKMHNLYDLKYIITELLNRLNFKPSKIATDSDKFFKNKQTCSKLDFKLVHRLDKNTTGNLIIAKTRIGAIWLHNAIKNKQLSKYYIAILDIKNNKYLAQILKTLNSTLSLRINLNDEVSEMKVLGFNQEQQKILCIFKLITGKKHQLRRHMIALDMPILFDKLYFDREKDVNISYTPIETDANINSNLTIELFTSNEIIFVTNLIIANIFKSDNFEYGDGDKNKNSCFLDEKNTIALHGIYTMIPKLMISQQNSIFHKLDSVNSIFAMPYENFFKFLRKYFDFIESFKRSA